MRRLLIHLVAVVLILAAYGGVQCLAACGAVSGCSPASQDHGPACHHHAPPRHEHGRQCSHAQLAAREARPQAPVVPVMTALPAGLPAAEAAHGPAGCAARPLDRPPLMDPRAALNLPLRI